MDSNCVNFIGRRKLQRTEQNDQSKAGRKNPGQLGDNSGVHTIELKLHNLAQLFNTLDPFPFHERSLSREAEDYLVARATEVPESSHIELIIYLKGNEKGSQSALELQTAVSAFFEHKTRAISRKIFDLLKEGRRALLVGLSVLGTCLVIVQLMMQFLPQTGVMRFVEEGLVIVGWVALWRPFEIFLYDWWPLAKERKVCKQLARSVVQIRPYLPEQNQFSGPAPE